MKKSVIFLVLIALATTAVKTFAGGVPPPTSLPDSGSTALMLVAGLAGLGWCRNRLRR